MWPGVEEMPLIDVDRLKSEAAAKLAVIASENLPKDVKRTLTMRIDTILSNYSESFLLDQLYWYLRMLHALRDAGQITEEQFRRLIIDPTTILL
jgi:hypothetical protein